MLGPQLQHYNHGRCHTAGSEWPEKKENILHAQCDNQGHYKVEQEKISYAVAVNMNTGQSDSQKHLEERNQQEIGIPYVIYKGCVLLSYSLCSNA